MKKAKKAGAASVPAASVQAGSVQAASVQAASGGKVQKKRKSPTKDKADPSEALPPKRGKHTSHKPSKAVSLPPVLQLSEALEQHRDQIMMLPSDAWPLAGARGTKNYTLTRQGQQGTICVRLASSPYFYCKPAKCAGDLPVDKAGGCCVKWGDDAHKAWQQALTVAGWT